MPDGAGYTVRDTPRDGLRVLTAHELLTLDLPPRETVLSPWLPSKGLAMIYGPRGIGKTHVSLGGAYAIASGGVFLRWQAATPRRVLVVDGEMPAHVLQQRLAAIADASGKEPPAPDYLRFLAIDLQERGLDLTNEGDREALALEIGNSEVIFLDNISTLARAGRENEAESWLPIQEWALEQRRAGRSVVFIHHAGKGGQQRGTSRREDVLDTVIALRKPTDHQPDQGARFELHYEKSRGFYGDDAQPFEAALGAAGWTTRNLQDADMARVVAMTDDGLSVREIAKETGLTKTKVGRLQTRARAVGLLGESGAA